MTADCAMVRAAAAELALGVLSGSDRAEVLHHLDGCADCRQEVAGLAGVADRLLGVVPPVDPPSGFESRVAEQLAAATPEARGPRVRRPFRLAAGAAVAVAAAITAFVVGVRVGEDGPPAGGDSIEDAGPAAPVARRLPLLAGGEDVGEIVLVAADGRRGTRLVCVLDDDRMVGAYRLTVLDEGGGSVASWTVTPGPARPWSWSAGLPIEPDAVARVVLSGPNGEARASTG